MKLESTVGYLGVAVDDVLEMADPTQRLDHQEPHRQSRYGRKYGGRLPGAFGTPDASVSGLGRRQCWVDHNGQHDGRWPCHDQTLRRGVEKGSATGQIQSRGGNWPVRRCSVLAADQSPRPLDAGQPGANSVGAVGGIDGSGQHA